MITKPQQLLENYHKAITSLQDAIHRDDGSDLHRDAIIQRFEYSAELIRKTLKKIYKYKGHDISGFPKELIKQAQEFGIISDATIYIDYINERNILSHNYSEEQAIDSHQFIIQNIQGFFTLYEDLVHYLNNEKTL